MAAQTYNVRMKDGTTTIVTGVLSETVVHEEQYNMENYRNELDAAYLGRAWDTATFSGETTPATTAIAESRDDRVNAVVPYPELFKRSRLNLWSGAGGTGDRLFFGWCDQILSYSIGTFSRA